jgi:cell wall-associated NlpC family hydrolase
VLKAVKVAGLSVALAACATAPRPRPALDGPPIDVAATDVAPADRTPAAARMVDAARAMLGQPYRYGGAAPGGFDCSGLVVYAAGGAGIRVPRTAREQLRAGTPIARRALRAGDLVFMHIARKDLHVGIAIDSDRFVHAPATGGYVRIDSLSAPPYAHGFVTGRRIIEDPSAPPDRRGGSAGTL